MMMSLVATATVYLCVSVASLSLGFVFSKPTAAPESPKEVVEEKDRDDSDSDEEEQTDLSKLTPQDCALVLVVRTDLGMSTGKIAAQCSHATLACYKTLASKSPLLLRAWAQDAYPKAVVRCASEDELLLLQAQAQSLNLCTRTIQDAGRTQIAAGSTTVLGIAGPKSLLDQFKELQSL